MEEYIFALVVTLTAFPLTTALLAMLVDTVTRVSAAASQENEKMFFLSHFLIRIQAPLDLKSRILRRAALELKGRDDTEELGTKWLKAFHFPTSLQRLFDIQVRRQVLVEFPGLAPLV